MLYHWFELGQVACRPARVAADTCRLLLGHPFNPVGRTPLGRSVTAACEVFERTTRRYSRPSFSITETTVDDVSVAVREETVLDLPFCRLQHFEREISEQTARAQPRILIVAPMSGHFATLLRGTVKALLPFADVSITDWQDARGVPYSAGRFDLDTYIDYIIRMLRLFEGDVHVLAVCQPTVPVMAAVSLLEEAGDEDVPLSMTLMGGPIDTRINPTAVNRLAEQRGLDWFDRNVITTVPWLHPGRGRSVYPGFLQLSGFMTMNLDRHVAAHKDLFLHLVRGDGDSALKHKEFYDEYLAVMDLAAEFYLQTVDTVFIRHALPKGGMTHRGQAIDPAAISRVALMTVEGEKDDITGVGQCQAAHALCSSLKADKRRHREQAGVGHYGIFNGSRFSAEILPDILDFIGQNDHRGPMRPAVLRSARPGKVIDGGLPTGPPATPS
ncbi:MAG: polyhydroxyalkanoate depolymerase [Hyphomicrobiaceae bacterium]